MPDVTSEPTNTERVATSKNFGGSAREDAVLGAGMPMPEAPPMEKWTIEQCAKSIRDDGRSVIAVVRDDTLRIKIQNRLIHRLVELVGEPKTAVSPGMNHPTVYWSHDRGFSLANQSPEERLQSTPTETDLIELVVPDDWK